MLSNNRFLSPSRGLQKGQALLVIVLIMVVTLTVGLSLASRSLVNTRTSADEESSQRAFSAAEAGIEQLLRSSQESLSDNDFGENAGFTASVVDNSFTRFLLNGGNIVPRDEGTDLWLSEIVYDAGGVPTYSSRWTGQFTVYWGEGASDASCSNPANVAAVEVVVLSGADKNNPVAQHYVYDSCAGRRSVNRFNGALVSGTSVDGVNFNRGATISVTNGFVARVIPLYANTRMGAVAAPELPPQGKEVESTGTSGGTARKITVFQSNPRLPIEIFPYAIFSP